MNGKQIANGNGNGLQPLAPGQPLTIVMTNVVVHASSAGLDAAGRPVLYIRAESRFCERVAEAVGRSN